MGAMLCPEAAEVLQEEHSWRCYGQDTEQFLLLLDDEQEDVEA